MNRLQEFKAPIEVQPGIKCLGYYFYRSARVMSQPRFRYGWNETKHLAVTMRTALNHLRLMASSLHYEETKRRKGWGETFSDNHQVVKWDMHGYIIYTWHTDGTVLLGLEVEEKDW